MSRRTEQCRHGRHFTLHWAFSPPPQSPLAVSRQIKVSLLPQRRADIWYVVDGRRGLRLSRIHAACHVKGWIPEEIVLWAPTTPLPSHFREARMGVKTHDAKRRWYFSWFLVGMVSFHASRALCFSILTPRLLCILALTAYITRYRHVTALKKPISRAFLSSDLFSPSFSSPHIQPPRNSSSTIERRPLYRRFCASIFFLYGARLYHVSRPHILADFADNTRRNSSPHDDHTQHFHRALPDIRASNYRHVRIQPRVSVIAGYCGRFIVPPFLILFTFSSRHYYDTAASDY